MGPKTPPGATKTAIARTRSGRFTLPALLAFVAMAAAGAPAAQKCQPPAYPTVVQQGYRDPVVILRVDGATFDQYPVYAPTPEELATSEDVAIARVFNPNARSPHFYALLDDGRHWILRAYCKDPVAVVSEEVLASGERPAAGDAVELGDWAFAIKVGAQRVLVWLKGEAEGRWYRVDTAEDIVVFTLGSIPGGVRVSYLTTAGALGFRTVGVEGLERIDMKRGPVASDATVELIDRGGSVYVLGPAFGLLQRRGQPLSVLYESQADRDLVWRDSFFGPRGRNFGVLLVYRVASDAGTTFHGVLYSLPEDGAPRRSTEIDLSGQLAGPLVEPPRIFVRPEDEGLSLLHACLVFNSGKAGTGRGQVRPLRLRRIFSTGAWAVEPRGHGTSLEPIDLEEIHVLGSSGRKEHVFHYFDDGERKGFICPL